jgi:DNA-binding HxlR family transcriptional regulator
MKAKPEPQSPRSACPINLVLEMVGDHWSLLILRDMMFKGHKSYQAFLRSEEGIATNILADRLQKLESLGLITKTADTEDARRFIYALTAMGANLAPLLVDMTLIGIEVYPDSYFPKDQVEKMRRNPQAFARDLARVNRPKVRRPKTKSHRGIKTLPEPHEETLGLFDGI